MTNSQTTRLSMRARSIGSSPLTLERSQVQTEPTPQPVHGGSHGDLRENITSNTSAIGELRDTHAVREELPAAGPQRREHSAATQELEPQPVLSEPLGHIAAIDEEQLEHASRSGVADGE